MHEEVAALRAKETRLAEIAGEYESYLDELSEEDKEQDLSTMVPLLRLRSKRPSRRGR